MRPFNFDHMQMTWGCQFEQCIKSHTQSALKHHNLLHTRSALHASVFALWEFEWEQKIEFLASCRDNLLCTCGFPQNKNGSSGAHVFDLLLKYQWFLRSHCWVVLNWKLCMWSWMRTPSHWLLFCHSQNLMELWCFQFKFSSRRKHFVAFAKGIYTPKVWEIDLKLFPISRLKIYKTSQRKKTVTRDSIIQWNHFLYIYLLFLNTQNFKSSRLKHLSVEVNKVALNRWYSVDLDDTQEIYNAFERSAQADSLVINFSPSRK